MWREFYYMIQLKPFFKEFINYCLSYTMCQPVDIDLQFIFILIIQYLGFYQLIAATQKLKMHWNKPTENYSIEIEA